MLARSSLARRSSGRYIVWSASIMRSSRSADRILVQDPLALVLAAPAAQDQLLRVRPGGEKGAVHVADRLAAHEPAQLVDALARALGGESGSDRARQPREAVPGDDRHAAEPRPDRLAHEPRQPAHGRQHACPVHVAVVAAEQLVAAVAAEGHGDVAARELATRAGSAAAMGSRTARRRCPAAAGSARARRPR